MQKVKPGDPLRIPAATFNTMIDAAADYRRRAQSGGRPRGRDTRSSDLVQVKNYTDGDCPRFGVMDAGGPIFWQVWNPDQEVAFKREVALGGYDAPWAAEGRLLVAAEPIGANKIGWCMATGLTQVRVNVTDSAHRGVYKVQGDITRLHSCPDSLSTAAVVWIENWTVGEHWAIIHVGARPALAGLQHGWATSNWHKAGLDNDAYVDVRPCNRQATSISTNPVRVHFPLRPFCDPNVELANVIQFEYDRDGDAIARNGYDAAIGTIRPTNVDSPYLIQGWSGITMDDGEVLAAGNVGQHAGSTSQTHTHDDHVIPSHGHSVQTSTIYYNPGQTLHTMVVTAVNAATGQTLPHNDVDARPRRYGVRFYVRVDNSAAG